MSAQLFYLPFRPALNANGLTISGAKLYFYGTGTTTLQAAYADVGLTTPLANPVVANAAGVWPSIYLDNTKIYRVVLKDAGGGVMADQDPYLVSITDNLTTALSAIATTTATNAALAASDRIAAGISAASAADSSALSADMSQFLLVLSRYYATRAAGVAATILGQLFTSDETGSLLIYKNVSSPPYYSLVTSTGSVTSVAASGGTTGLSFTGGPVTSSGTLTLSGTLAVANGGTGGATQAAARSGIGAAAAGSNSDITALTGLSTAITIAQGGTGSTTQGGARGNLGLGSAATMTGPSGAIVGDSDSQTLTNKTLTAPTLTSPVINSAQFATVTGSAPLFGIRAWGSFTCPSGSVTVNGSGNVSSVTRSSAGIYVVAFTTAMPDTNYSVTATGSRTGSASGWDNYQVYGLSTGGFTISCETTSNVGVDQALVNFQVVR